MDGIPDYPDTSILIESFWSTILPPWAELMRPLILVNLSFGADSIDVSPLRIDTMVRALPEACGPLSPASGGGSVTLSTLDPLQVCVDDAMALAPPNLTHETRVMKIEWGDTSPAGTIHWSIAQNLADYSYLSLRVGNSHDSSVTTAFDLTVNLRGLDDQGQPLDAPVSLGPQIQQDDSPPPVFVPDVMHTIRVPLRDFCVQGLDLTTVDQLSMGLPVSADLRSVLIDSIEFTRDPDDGPTGCT